MGVYRIFPTVPVTDMVPLDGLVTIVGAVKDPCRSISFAPTGILILVFDVVVIASLTTVGATFTTVILTTPVFVFVLVPSVMVYFRVSTPT